MMKGDQFQISFCFVKKFYETKVVSALVSICFGSFVVVEFIVSIPLLATGWGKGISTILRIDGIMRLENLFWNALDWKGVVNFSRGYRVNCKFYFTTLICLNIYVQIERCITCYFSLRFLAYFFLLKVFSIVFYFIDSLFMWKNVQKLTQVSAKTSRISYFFRFKLNQKKKIQLTSMVWIGRGGYKRHFAGRGFNH